MDYIGNLFTEAVQDMLSVFSDPVVLVPVTVCVLLAFMHNLLFAFVSR